jgi:hypothetical protein
MAIKFLIFEHELVNFVCRGNLGAWDGFLEGLGFMDWWHWQWTFFWMLVEPADTWVREFRGGGLVNL